MPSRVVGPRVPRRWRASAWAPALVTLLALCASACGSAGRPATGSRLAPDVILLEEIQQSSASNAYDLVSQARPNWLRGRGASSFRSSRVELPVVYLDDRPQGAPEILRSFAIHSVAELRYINATSATTRYGEGHAGGIIQVVLLRR